MNGESVLCSLSCKVEVLIHGVKLMLDCLVAQCTGFAKKLNALGDGCRVRNGWNHD